MALWRQVLQAFHKHRVNPEPKGRKAKIRFKPQCYAQRNKQYAPTQHMQKFVGIRLEHRARRAGERKIGSDKEKNEELRTKKKSHHKGILPAARKHLKRGISA